MLSRALRKLNEIRHFSKQAESAPLPQIYHHWSNTFLRPRVQAIFNNESYEHLFADVFLTALRKDGAPQRLLSLGSGACRVELKVAQSLIARGETDFEFECVEMTGARVHAAQKAAEAAGLSGYFVFTNADVDRWTPDKTYAAVMANQSLHHFEGLEHVFQAIVEAMEPEGYFVTADMIGRNGHQRWPEALQVINAIWQSLPDRYKVNHTFGGTEATYINRDFSKKQNEGIRAQDILPLLQHYFSFEKFCAYGNVIDPFISRSFGHNYTVANEADVDLIARIDAINESLIDNGCIKPTQMRAVLTKQKAVNTKTHKHWTPAFATRTPEDTLDHKSDQALTIVANILGRPFDRP